VRWDEPAVLAFLKLHYGGSSRHGQGKAARSRHAVGKLRLGADGRHQVVNGCVAVAAVCLAVSCAAQHAVAVVWLQQEGLLCQRRCCACTVHAVTAMHASLLQPCCSMGQPLLARWRRRPCILTPVAPVAGACSPGAVEAVRQTTHSAYLWLSLVMCLGRLRAASRPLQLGCSQLCMRLSDVHARLLLGPWPWPRLPSPSLLLLGAARPAGILGYYGYGRAFPSHLRRRSVVGISWPQTGRNGAAHAYAGANGRLRSYRD